MLSMTRNEAIPYEAMKAGIAVGLGHVPRFHRKLIARPKGVIC